MVAAVPLFLVFGMITAHLVQEISGLMCYNCNSLYQSACEHIKAEDKFSVLYQHCSPYPPDVNVTEYRRPLCRKVIQKIKVRDDLRVVLRTCGYIKHKNLDEDVCYEIKNESHDEMVCQCFEDGCNSARSIFASFSSLGVLFCIVLSVLLNIR